MEGVYYNYLEDKIFILYKDSDIFWVQDGSFYSIKNVYDIISSSVLLERY